MCAPEMGIHVIDTHCVCCCVRGAIVKVTGLDVEDASPGFDLRRRHVAPVCAAVHGHLDIAVICTCPDHIDIPRRWGQCRDRSLLTHCYQVGVFTCVAGDVPRGARKVGADACPAFATIQSLPHGVRGIEKHVRVYR